MVGRVADRGVEQSRDLVDDRRTAVQYLHADQGARRRVPGQVHGRPPGISGHDEAARRVFAATLVRTGTAASAQTAGAPG